MVAPEAALANCTNGLVIVLSRAPPCTLSPVARPVIFTALSLIAVSARLIVSVILSVLLRLTLLATFLMFSATDLPSALP